MTPTDPLALRLFLADPLALLPSPRKLGITIFTKQQTLKTQRDVIH